MPKVAQTQLFGLLSASDVNISFATILCSRQMLGWTFRGSKYCQLVRTANKEKRLQWVIENLPEIEASGFDNVILTDEASVQLESQRRHSYRKKGRASCFETTPKASYKGPCVGWHQQKGPTPIVIFEGKMNASLYIEVLLQNGLVSIMNFQIPIG